MNFDASTIMNLVGQLGGNHQQAAQQLQGMGQVDPEQHAGLLNQLGVNPQQLMGGGYQQHLDAQQQSAFQGYQQGQDPTSQQPDFGGNQQQGDYQQREQQGGHGQPEQQGDQQQDGGYVEPGPNY